MADETRGQVLKEPGRNPETDSFMWLFCFGENGLAPIILYHYTETRAKYNAAVFLDGLKDGYLETDGYEGYNHLPGVKWCACWSHMRHYFDDAVPKGKEFDYSNATVQGVQFCSKLFRYKRIAAERKMDPDQRKEYRLQTEKPVFDAFWEWLGQQRPHRGIRFEKAVNDAQNRKEDLMRYLEDGHCSFSNNLSKNAIRPFNESRNYVLKNITAKTGFSVTLLTEPSPVPLCTRW